MRFKKFYVERTAIRPTVQDKKLKNLRIPNPNYKDGLKRKEKSKRAMYNDVTTEGTMGNKPEWGTPESKRKAKKITPGETSEACWDGYKQVGTKIKSGRSVPNCVPEDCGCEDCKSKRMKNEKLTIGKIRRAAYKTGKVLGDVQAVKKNKVAKRVKNRLIGKMAAKALSGLFK